MKTGIVWHMLDRDAEIGISERHFPHWDQTGALTFVTFRLADSMPKSVIQRWIDEQKQWLIQNGIKFHELDDVIGSDLLPMDLRRKFKQLRQRIWNNCLDDCHGASVLRDPANAQIVAETLLHFDGQRYDLERFVVMPNHVHLLVQMRHGHALRKQYESWMRFSARQINHRLGRHGELWQSEPFDHVVRSEWQFQYLQTYCSENPVKAGLKEGEFLLWIRGLHG